ncbi:MAG: response regulator [Anaerolinea sp.]|nr:response regulator [Anaerolinea sp.]
MNPMLVVDDESATRRLVAYTLKSLNIEVLGAENGASAMQIAYENPLGLILVDINLPGIDGFTLIEQLRTIPHISDVPVIMFTARNNANDEMRARELGASGFLYKPFTTQELRNLVHTYIMA